MAYNSKIWGKTKFENKRMTEVILCKHKPKES